MPSAKSVFYYATHPGELRSILQWKMWHDPVHRRNKANESADLQECFRFLNMTSRSFAAVIQELNHELLVPITLFYLVLRGLDTVEDDMNIPLDEKVPILRNFHRTMHVEGWNFHGSTEKDAELLEKFHVVVAELSKLKPQYREIIDDMTEKMGNGMADYAGNTEMLANGIQTVEEYELYCHYVAGLVGEGLTRLLVASELANPKLGERMELTESMGQFLQKTNIIRDIHEDWEDGRRWYPKEIWSKHADTWEDLLDPKHRQQAVYALNEMVLDALKHVEECLFYMAGMRDQSAFNFVAIPQAMAIATLEACFQNPDVFERNVKITKGDACQIMLESTQNLQIVTGVFKRYVRKIQQKNDPRDPNFLAVSVQCAKIEQFIETLFPRQNPKTMVSKLEDKTQSGEGSMDKSELLVFLGIITAGLLTVSAIMIFTAWILGARFDLVFSELKNFIPYWSSGTGTPELTLGKDEL